MPPAGEDALRSLMEPVARRLLGEPNKALSTAKILRWGNKGSMAVDVEKGVFFNNELKTGGGVVIFVERQLLLDQHNAWEWLHDEYPDQVPRKTNGHAPPGAVHISKAYDYPDADWTLLFQVCRKTPKGFVQRRPDPAAEGGWDWSTKGVKQVPYRLPELITDIAEGREIWVPEGEKDVDRLRAAGLAATCNAGGAGKWRAALNPYLKGAYVTIIADNDQAGRDHAADVARQLTGVAARVRVLDLGARWADCPPKGDVSDFLDAAGKMVADLEGLAADEMKAPAVLPGAFTAASLEGLPVPPRLWHVRDLVPARTVTLIGGDGGVGKSILALQLAFATATGLSWIGQAVRQGRALHLSAEDDRDELHRRVDQISTFYGMPLEKAPGLTLWSLADDDAVLVTGSPGQTLQATSRWGELQRYIELDKPALVVLDSLADVYGANENERPQVRQFVRLLRGLAMPADTAVLLLGHPSLTGLSSGSGLSGSTHWNNSVRSRMFMAAPETEDGGASEPNLRTLTVKKANYTQAGAELRLRWVAGAFDTEGGQMASTLDKQVAADRVDALFLELLDAFTAAGRVVSDSTGRNYAPHLFASDPRARGTTKAGFEAAMNRLFAVRAIHVGSIGKGSHARRTIVRS
jgi:RecA-family ATPase